MNALPTPPDPAKVAKLVAAAAVSLFLISNLAWAVAYSSLSARVVGVDSGLYSSTSPSARASASPLPTPTPSGQATISGTLTAPTDGDKVPPQLVCAVNTTDDSQKVCASQPGGSKTTYSLKVAPGSYYVYASLATADGDITTSYRAYYNEFVTCQRVNNCAAGLHNHYVAVTVSPGQTASDIDPTDWSALGLGQ